MFGQLETTDMLIILAIVILLFSACRISKIVGELNNIRNFKKDDVEGEKKENEA